MRSHLPLLVIVAIAAGCATYSPAPEEVVPVPASQIHALPVVTSANPARITVIRDFGFPGSAVLFHLSLDGARLASLDRGERLEFEVDPGEHQLSVIPTDYFGGHKPTVVDAIWRPGQRVLYRVGMSGNMVPSLIRDVSAPN